MPRQTDRSESSLGAQSFSWFCHEVSHFINFRGFLSGFIATVDAYIRGAIQYFCVEMLLSLTDKVSTLMVMNIQKQKKTTFS